MATAVDPWHVTLNGVGYQLDLATDQFKHDSAPMLRQQSDTGDKPGESSLNPAGLWRRSQETWHWGAGQSHLDRGDSSPARFNASTNVNVWDRFGLSALPATTLIHASANTNLYLTTASGRLYCGDGTAVRVTGVGDTTFAAATGLPGTTIRSMCSDGTYCYASVTGINSGFYRSSGTAFTQWVTDGEYSLLRFVKGRLLGTGIVGNSSIYNITATGITPASLWTHPNASWTWTDFGEGPNHIYASGYASDKSMIYKTSVKPDGTALDVPTAAATLPDGEIARSLTGYLGYVVIGTDKGVRFAVADADGNLTLGALIQADTPVYCAEGQDRFVWYGLSQFPNNAPYGGLGRIDLSQFTSDLTPAYATDLNSPSTGSVKSVTTYTTAAGAPSEMVTNTGFEVNTTGWGATPAGYSASTTLARSTAQAHTGSASGLVTWPTGARNDAAVQYAVSGLTVGKTYRALIWVRLSDGPPVQFRELFGNVAGADTSTTVVGAWQQLSITFVATLTTHYLGLSTAAATTTGQVMYVDDMSVKEVTDSGALTVYTQSGYGVVTSTTLLAASGSLTTGRISYGLPDQKTPLKVKVSYDPLPEGASVDVYLSSDNQGFQLLGTDSVTASTDCTFTPAATPAADFEVQVAYRDGDVTIHRITLYSDPIPDRTEFIRVPLDFHDTVTNGAGDTAFDVAAAYDALMALWQARTVVAYKEGDKTWQVVVDDYTWLPDEPTSKPGYWTGTFLAVLKAVG